MVQITDKIEETYSNFIAKRTYTRWLDDEKRRESWDEAVQRYSDFFEPKVPASLLDAYKEAIELKKNKQVMGSMRALWSAGPALEENNFAGFNCCYIALNSIDKFGEILYLMMHGCGVGFSVERQYVSKLPEVPENFEELGTTAWIVADSKLGWKEAVDFCVNSIYNGLIPTFDYSLVRPKGARLKTFGGRASGPEPLKQLMSFIIRICKNARGRKLNSIEVHDIATMVGECVVVGGVRRSACISFSNLSDNRMKHAKDGQFWLENPQRRMANNSIAYTEKPESALFMEEWLNLIRSGSGERGIYNTVSAREKADRFNRMDGDVRSNPCFTGDMRLYTIDGYKSFESLENQEIEIVDIFGEPAKSKVWCSGEKETVEISFWNKEFDSIRCTPDHVFLLADTRECQAQNLKGYRIMPFFTTKKYFDRLPFMAGFIQGDGNTSRLLSKDHAGIEINIGINDGDIATLLELEVKGRTCYSIEAKEIAKKYNLSSNTLPTRNFPEYSFSTIELMNFLSGLYSANGSIIKNNRVAFKTTNKTLADKLQDILYKYLNIESYITTNKLKNIKFDNGIYECRESYDLNINKLKSIIMFAKYISFAQKYKQEALNTLIKTKAPVVKSVKNSIIEKVYDFTESKYHWGIVEGIIVHNCGEALLMDRQCCNLTEVVVRPEDTKEDLEEKIRAAVLLGCIQSTLTHFPNVSPLWKENAEKERLIGVSLTGVCDSPLFKKVNDKTCKMLRELKKFAHKCSEEFAKELGIVAPKQVTLVKPSGTVSQLCNCSSGIHARHSDYYIRRVRVTAKDPIAHLLMSKNVPCNPEVGSTWEDYNTLVFDFPIKSPRGSLNRDDFSALEQLEYWKMFNDNWCDGNPSVTISCKDDEWVEVGAWVYKNWDAVCGLAFLPYDGSHYPLSPYESISKEEYYDYCKPWTKINIDFDAELNQFELEDNTEGAQTLSCTGISCEI